ncbi:MAG: DUF2752 domain-containing protein [Phycisphaeraceae bacterium]
MTTGNVDAEPTGPGRRWLRCALRLSAGGAAAMYVVWNVAWLTSGQLPPALFYAITGWPAPTTGSTRALLALFELDWRRSLTLNPLALPLAGLLVVTVAWPAARWCCGRRASLPGMWPWLWLAAFVLGWAGHAAVALLR